MVDHVDENDDSVYQANSNEGEGNDNTTKQLFPPSVGFGYLANLGLETDHCAILICGGTGLLLAIEKGEASP